MSLRNAELPSSYVTCTLIFLLLEEHQLWFPFGCIRLWVTSTEARHYSTENTNRVCYYRLNYCRCNTFLQAAIVKNHISTNAKSLRQYSKRSKTDTSGNRDKNKQIVENKVAYVHQLCLQLLSDHNRSAHTCMCVRLCQYRYV
jgi:hypothetical protein